MPPAHIQPWRTNALQVELPFGKVRTAAPGSDVVQQWIVGKVRRPVQWRAAAQQGWRADGEDLFVQQRRREHARVAAIIQVNGQVEVARVQRLRTVFGHQAQFDIRIPLLEARQARCQPLGQE
ncbi:hypothetical protein D3C81_1683990 [compost metagenome]